MRTKHFLTAMVLPALFAACTQEEVAFENDAKVDLSNRPVLSKVTLSIDEANTRMSVADGSDYIVKPDAGDGLGACIIDIPNYALGGYDQALEDAKGDATKLYDVKEFISSNYRYSQAEGGLWETQALLSEGNYVSYAPHSETYLLREPLAVKVPTVQNVTKEEPNKAVKEYYANATTEGYPIVIDYQFLKADGQEKKLNVKFRHIMSYPLFTLKNDFKEGETGKAIKVTKVVFEKVTGKFTVKAPLLNGEQAGKGIAKLALGGSDPKWINYEIEDAATSQVLSNVNKEESETITVNFGEEGIEIAAGEEFSFYAVMPAENYTTLGTNNHLRATVYTADNKQFKDAFELGNITMNPGKRYPAQEYNTRMGNEKPTLKETAGTLATISLKGELVDLQTKATGLKNNKELIDYLSKVATRYRDLIQVNEDFVKLNNFESATVGYVKYNEGLHFTLAEDAKIIINDELIEALIKYIWKDDLGGSIKFLSSDVEAGKVVIGNTSKLGEYDIEFNGVMGAKATDAAVSKDYIPFGANAAPKTIKLSAGVTELTEAMAGINNITVPAGATLNLAEELNDNTLAIVNDGGIVNVAAGVVVKSIDNKKGNLNFNGDVTETTITVTNGALEMQADGTTVQEYTDEELTTKNESASNVAYFVKVLSKATITIAENMAVSCQITNHPTSVINNNGFMNGTATGNKNGGTIVLGSKADLNVAVYGYNNYVGVIKNDGLAVIRGTVPADADVVCSLDAMPKMPVKGSKINHVVFTKNVELAKDVFASTKVLEGVTRVDLNGCATITTPEALTDATGVDFYVYNNLTWVGDKMTSVDLQTAIKTLNVKKGVTVTKIGVDLPTVTEFE